MLTCPKCGFSNQEAAKFCSNCGNPIEVARAIEGERKFATILFADVARSTALAEQLDPEDWALIMNGAFGFMNAAVSKYGGTVSRLMGDAVLALFGAPVAHEDDAERAVRAGLEIQEAAARYAQAVKQSQKLDFQLRVGINTGTAVLAFVGDAIKTEYTAMGDTANIAARLQSAAEPGTVLISADTHRLVHGYFEFRERGTIEMKGKTLPVECFEVTGARAVPENPRGLMGLSSPLVGRQAELDLLQQKLEDLAKGVGSVVAVTGEAGLGKSRLAAELRQQCDAMPEPRIGWLEARSISYAQSIPYHLWRQLGRQIVGASEMDEPQAVRDKLAALVTRLGLKADDVPFYETMLAVDTEATRLTLSGLSGDAVVSGVATATVNCVKAAIHANDGTMPFVYVLDDLHWSDNATLELIAQVATLAAFEPIMLICMMRPDRKAPSWQVVDRLQGSLGSAFTRLDLEPLDSRQSGELLGNLLAIEDLPATIRTQILERSEGNPFYLEEVLRSLIDGGQVVNESGHWKATEAIIGATIPETLAGVLSARIDRLPETSKRLAQTASVLGRVFMHRLLESVCRNAPLAERIDHIEPHLATLSYEQVVREETRIPERQYAFKHAVTCEAAYGLLLKSRRRDLHARAGLALEALFGDRGDEFAGMLAYHFGEADDVERAIAYSRRAAAAARKLYASREELQHRERILTLLERSPNPAQADMVDAVTAWAEVRHHLNLYDGVIERLKATIEIARELHDKRRLATVLSWTGNIYMVTGFPVSSFPYITEAKTLADAIGDETLMLLPLFTATWSMVDRSPAAAIRALDEVIALARKYHANDVLGHAITYRAVALARLGRFDEARAEIDAGLAIAPLAGSPVKEADIHIGAGMAYYELGDIEKGLEHSQIGAIGAQRVNGLQCACAGYLGVGRGELEQHRLDAALGDFRNALSYAQGAPMAPFANQINGSVAVAEFERGSPAAIDAMRLAVKNARDFGDDFAAHALGRRLADALLRSGRAAEAETLLQSALVYYRERDMAPYIKDVLVESAAVHEQLDKLEEAKRERDEAERLDASLPIVPPVAAATALSTEA